MSIFGRARELMALKAAARIAKGCKVYAPRNPVAFAAMFRITEAERRQLRALLDGRR
ncbi:hypothetical protein [Xanthomonas euvesicatoria]|uniref:hypothetical protein n=1 Tax=Xanthomonas euvesicatoria TaxID=456327 RepID=UPI001C45469F|nr:hypothetical protein [Xanthomonas euvesicatoria]MBV6885927.1 hypothetical protein [Xanthomonas campestris pv. euphorbiae]